VIFFLRPPALIAALAAVACAAPSSHPDDAFLPLDVPDAASDAPAGPEDASEPQDDGGPEAEAPDCPDPAAPPAVGAVIVCEIMYAPRAVPDEAGEWVEVCNTTGCPVDVAGWTLAGGEGESVVIAPGGSLVLPVEGRRVLGRSADVASNGGVPVDFAYGDAIAFESASDRVALIASGVLIDEVVFGEEEGFDRAFGTTLSLAPDFMTHVLNDSFGGWCATDQNAPLPGGDFGTPGQENQTCCQKCG